MVVANGCLLAMCDVLLDRTFSHSGAKSYHDTQVNLTLHSSVTLQVRWSYKQPHHCHYLLQRIIIAL